MITCGATANAPLVFDDSCCTKCGNNLTFETIRMNCMISSAKAAYLNEAYEESQEQLDYLISKCAGNTVCTQCG
jgi:hypothetical protein